MKKLVLAIAVVAGFASCEKQAQVEEKGSLKLKATVEETTIGKKGGVVSDAGIPIYVKGVDVTVTGPGGYAVSENFMYAADGTDAMVVDGVALGVNNVVAKSIPVDNAFPHTFMEAHTNDWSNWAADASDLLPWIMDFQDLRAFMGTWGGGDLDAARASKFISFIVGSARDQEKGSPVYAVYEGTGTGVVKNLDEAAKPLEVAMTTNNGRQMVSFIVSDLAMLDLYDIEINGVCETSPLVQVEGRYHTTTSVDGFVQLDANTPFAVSYWSNENAVDGASTTYTINIKETGTNVVLRTDVVKVTVKAGVSMWTNIVINETAFFVDNQPLSITYVPLLEEDEDVTID